jgi:hypothetical protein
VPTSVDLDRDIRFAIEHRRLVRLTYNGRGRVCEPHDYGLINHAPKLLVWQRREDGNTRPPGWRLLALEKVVSLVLLDDEFGGSRDASQQHRFSWDPLIGRVR